MTNKKQHLAALALGGVGKIGQNMMVYECNGDFIVVDAGQSFGDESTPGVESIIPDTKFLRDHAKHIKAVFITHGHEDHIGGIAYLWDDFAGAKVYASPLTKLAIDNKLAELGIKPAKGQIVSVKVGERIAAGQNFSVEYIPVAHSILEAFGLAIRTPYGTIAHTGDYKFDGGAPFGQETDEAKWGALGKEGVLAVFGDSTNIFKQDPSGSEADVAKHLETLISGAKQRIFFAAFASHAGRAITIAKIAKKYGRQVCFMGRTINKMMGYCKEVGYFPAELKGWIVEAEEAAHLPADKVLIFASGTQGETAASLSRMATGQVVRGMRITQGDTVILSSRMIPGNEKPILTVINGLYAIGAEVFSEINDRDVHVSGHASQPEIKKMYSLIKPRYVVPVHGEPMHLLEHRRVADAWGYHGMLMKPGHKLVLANVQGDDAFIDPHAYHVGANYVDGLNILNNECLPVKERRKMAYDGVVAVGMAVSRRNKEWLGDLTITTKGLIDEQLQKALLDKANAACVKVLEKAFPDAIIDDLNMAREAISQSIRKTFKTERGKTPTVLVNVVEIE